MFTCHFTKFHGKINLRRVRDRDMAQSEISKYITEITRIYKEGNATEHSYRPALQRLLEALIGVGMKITNEPKRIACGAPDYIVTRGGIPVGYIEAKDIGTDLSGKANKEQFDRCERPIKLIQKRPLELSHFFTLKPTNRSIA